MAETKSTQQPPRPSERQSEGRRSRSGPATRRDEAAETARPRQDERLIGSERLPRKGDDEDLADV